MMEVIPGDAIFKGNRRFRAYIQCTFVSAFVQIAGYLRDFAGSGHLVKKCGTVPPKPGRLAGLGTGKFGNRGRTIV